MPHVRFPRHILAWLYLLGAAALAYLLAHAAHLPGPATLHTSYLP